MRDTFPAIPPQRRHVIVAAIALLVIAGCGATPRAVTRSGATPTPTAAPNTTLPPFTDWRIAYESQDGHLHAVTPDGKTDIMGPIMPDVVNNAGEQMQNAGASPNGRFIAYFSGLGVEVLDMHARTIASFWRTGNPSSAIQNPLMFWSPDSAHLATSPLNTGGQSLIWLAAIPSNTLTFSPALTLPQNPPIASLAGWLDDTHLLVRAFDANGHNLVLESLDATNTTTLPIASFASAQLGNGSEDGEAVSSDGRQILFYTNQAQAYPFTPQLDVIDTATGSVRSLSTVLATLGPILQRTPIFAVAWKPGTETVVLTTGSYDMGTPRNWLIDLATDTITLLPFSQYALGWLPGSNTLITGTMLGNKAGAGPNTLSAITFGPSGQPQAVVLTRNAWTFQFLGFIRGA